MSGHPSTGAELISSAAPPATLPAELNPFRRRTLVLAILQEFRSRLLDAGSDESLADAVDAVRDRLVAVQGTPADAPYLAKSVCQLATWLRRSNRPALGADLLAWACRRGAFDVYSYCEWSECHLSQGDHEGALEILLQGLARNSGHDSLHTSLIRVHLLRGHAERASAVLRSAVASGIATVYMSAMFVEHYWRLRDLDAAQRAYADPGFPQPAIPSVYVTMLKVCGRARKVARAERIFADANAAQMVESRTYAALIDVYAVVRNLPAAHRRFAEAESRGLADDEVYAALIRALNAAHRHRQARRVFRQATALRMDLSPYIIAAALDAGMRPLGPRPSNALVAVDRRSSPGSTASIAAYRAQSDLGRERIPRNPSSMEAAPQAERS